MNHTKSTRITKLFLFLSLLFIGLTGCNVQEMDLSKEGPELAADLGLPPEEGGNDINCALASTITTSHQLLSAVPSYIPYGGTYDFAVQVTKSGSCSFTRASDKKCAITGTMVSLGFVDSEDFNAPSMSKIEHVAVFNSSGGAMSYDENDNGVSVPGAGSVIVCFKLKPAYSSLNVTNSDFSSGGLCIIGIVTDPDPPVDPDPINNNGNG